uniref:C2 domain-containing protein n=1 Tax=Macrostomum lignano TaxID=282301 RepID=A0A1I8IXX7_9PLAT
PAVYQLYTAPYSARRVPAVHSPPPTVPAVYQLYTAPTVPEGYRLCRWLPHLRRIQQEVQARRKNHFATELPWEHCSPDLSRLDHCWPSASAGMRSGFACRRSAGARMEEQRRSPTAEKEITKVVISVKCRDLPVEKSFAVISLHSGSYMNEKDTVTTETVERSSSPAFRTPLLAVYKFEERQMVELEVYSAQEEVRHGERRVIGTCSVSLGHVIHNGGQIVAQLDSGVGSGANSGRAKCLFHVEEYGGNKETLMLKLSGRGLDKKDLFGKSDPYVIIEKRNDKGRLVRAYRTEVIKNTLDPDWKPVKVSMDKLCGGDFGREIRFRCFDWDGAEGDPEDKDIEFDELIGEFFTTPSDLLDGREICFDLVNPRKQKKKKNYKNSGVVISVDSQGSFLDYMFGGE